MFICIVLDRASFQLLLADVQEDINFIYNDINHIHNNDNYLFMN
jgi:hypothetical protein